MLILDFVCDSFFRFGQFVARSRNVGSRVSQILQLSWVVYRFFGCLQYRFIVGNELGKEDGEMFYGLMIQFG